MMVGKTLPAPLLSQLSQLLAARMGLHFPPERWTELERGLTAAAKEFKMADAKACADWLLSSTLTRQQVEILAANLTVGETYFFREKLSFDALEREILPGIIRGRRGGDQRLRIWSAACSTGEEAYSIAMMLRQNVPDLADWTVTILATDINPRFLKQAGEGVFGEWSFRETPEWMRDRFFRKIAKGRYQILPEIKDMVTFDYLNLAEDIYPSLLNQTNAMDVILCRNVLMYFAPDQARKVIANLHHALVDGGWLVVSPSEYPHVQVPPFVAMSFPGAILYQKVLERESAGCAAESPDTIALPDSASITEPEQPRALAQLARAFADQGRLAEALAASEKAIAADKLSPAYHYLHAMILQEQGANEESRASLQRALYLDPRFVVAHFAMGHLTRAQGEEREAQKHFANASRLLRDCGPDDPVPEADGIAAGRLAAILAATMKEEPAP